MPLTYIEALKAEVKRNYDKTLYWKDLLSPRSQKDREYSDIYN